jgi:hypothetical protein
MQLRLGGRLVKPAMAEHILVRCKACKLAIVYTSHSHTPHTLKDTECEVWTHDLQVSVVYRLKFSFCATFIAIAILGVLAEFVYSLLVSSS